MAEKRAEQEGALERCEWCRMPLGKSRYERGLPLLFLIGSGASRSTVLHPSFEEIVQRLEIDDLVQGSLSWRAAPFLAHLGKEHWLAQKAPLWEAERWLAEREYEPETSWLPEGPIELRAGSEEEAGKRISDTDSDADRRLEIIREALSRSERLGERAQMRIDSLKKRSVKSK
jgi:hypothetical protein